MITNTQKQKIFNFFKTRISETITHNNLKYITWNRTDDIVSPIVTDTLLTDEIISYNDITSTFSMFDDLQREYLSRYYDSHYYKGNKNSKADNNNLFATIFYLFKILYLKNVQTHLQNCNIKAILRHLLDYLVFVCPDSIYDDVYCLQHLHVFKDMELYPYAEMRKTGYPDIDCISNVQAMLNSAFIILFDIKEYDDEDLYNRLKQLKDEFHFRFWRNTNGSF